LELLNQFDALPVALETRHLLKDVVDALGADVALLTFRFQNLVAVQFELLLKRPPQARIHLVILIVTLLENVGVRLKYFGRHFVKLVNKGLVGFKIEVSTFFQDLKRILFSRRMKQLF